MASDNNLGDAPRLVFNLPGTWFPVAITDEGASEQDVERMARDMGLAIFGSSDYHGTGKPNRIGENTTNPDVIAEVVAQGCIEVVRP